MNAGGGKNDRGDERCSRANGGEHRNVAATRRSECFPACAGQGPGANLARGAPWRGELARGGTFLHRLRTPASREERWHGDMHVVTGEIARAWERCQVLGHADVDSACQAMRQCLQWHIEDGKPRVPRTETHPSDNRRAMVNEAAKYLQCASWLHSCLGLFPLCLAQTVRTLSCIFRLCELGKPKLDRQHLFSPLRNVPVSVFKPNFISFSSRRSHPAARATGFGVFLSPFG